MVAWLLIGLYAAAIAPLRLGVAVRLGSGQEARGEVGLMLWGVAFQVQARLTHAPGQKPRLIFFFRGKPLTRGRKRKKGAAGKWLRAMRRANIARTLLKKTVHLHRLTVEGTLGFSDAAATALAVGALRAMNGARRTLCRVSPDFRGQSRVRAVCIVDARLGTLLAVCLLGAASLCLAGR